MWRSDTAGIEFLFGALKDTTVALETYDQIAARLYVEKLMRHDGERGLTCGEGKLSLSHGDQASK
jgi:hypothetical protein